MKAKQMIEQLKARAEILEHMGMDDLLAQTKAEIAAIEPPAPNLIYPLTLYIAPWQGTPILPADRLTQKSNGWIEAVFLSPAEVHEELVRLIPVLAIL